MLVDEIWSTWTENNLDFNEQDKKNDIIKVYNCQTALSQFLYHGMDEDTYLDHLIAYGVNPDAYITQVQQNVSNVVKSSTPLEDLDFITSGMGIFR